jgi:hypothetical protein
MTRIGIIDMNEGRARGIASVLKRADPELEIVHFGRLKRWNYYSADGGRFEHTTDARYMVQLCFWHYSNRPCGDDPTMDLPLHPDGCDGVERIWYGADGPRYELKFEWNINTALVSGAVENQFTERRAQQILAWCLNPNRNPEDVPELLRRAPPTEALPALSILCQGYLTAFAGAAAQEGIQVSADVELALGRMGFSGIPAEFAEHIKGRISEIRRRAWWRNPFEGTDWESDLRTEVKDASGGKVPRDLENLVTAILQGDAEQPLCHASGEKVADHSDLELPEANLVAKAYCQVESMLDRDKETPTGSQLNEFGPDASKVVTHN